MNLLGAKLYDPSTAASKSTASLLAMTALDTTNLRLTVTVPAHGFLFVRMRCCIEGATTFPQVLLGVLDGATVRGRVQPSGSLGGTAVATTRDTLVAEFTIPGLSPGSMTLDAAYGVEIVVASTNIKYGGPNNTTTDDAWGAFVFEIWDPQPLTTGLDGGVNVKQWLGTAVTADTAGVPNVNTNRINNVSASSVTTINANQGTTQPINFTSTGANALVKSDMVDIAGAAVSTTTAQIGVNCVQWNALTTVALPLVPTTAGRTLDVSATGEAGIDWSNIGAPTTVQDLSGTTISTSQVVASVTGAVGSVAGNVVGSVNSVVTRVTANTDQIEGVDATNQIRDSILSDATRFPGADIDATISSRAPASTAVSNVDYTAARAVKLDNLDAAMTTRATPAQVNTEVVDALSVDTYAEPGQEVPAATNTLAIKIGYTFKAWRNKSDQTGALYQLYSDAGVVDQKAAVSDDGTTFTRQEVASGP